MKAILLLDEMPVRCIDCPCMYMVKNSHISEHYCKATIVKDHYLKIENVCERPKWCPLKPIPKGHGDLKDAERLKDVFRRNTGYDYHDLIDIAPTIIKTDTGEEE